MNRVADRNYPLTKSSGPAPSAPKNQTGANRAPALGRQRLLIVLVGAAVLLVSVASGFFFGKRGPNAPEAAAAAQPHAQVLEALGSLSATHLYQSYLNIGMLGDAVEHGGYTVAQANDMLTTVVRLMSAVDQQLDQVAKLNLNEDDQRDVDRIRELSGLMKLQVAALRVYWLTQNPQEAARYQESREKAWTALSEMLGQ